MAGQDLTQVYDLLRDQQKEIADLKTNVEVLKDRGKRQLDEIVDLKLTLAATRADLGSIDNRLGRLGWLGSVLLAVAAAVGALLKGAASLWTTFSAGSH